MSGFSVDCIALNLHMIFLTLQKKKSYSLIPPPHLPYMTFPGSGKYPLVKREGETRGPRHLLVLLVPGCISAPL